ncbi:MAG: TetR/AcrR family transcriptional regulator [Oscillospiraceae bacterium]|nr:TetR/AcrR family transcriptional regulator [Oscillospiraceae bacterium]
MSNEIKKKNVRDTNIKRQLILNGAVKVFTKNGFEGSSMDKIAEVSGVSKRTVYNHFQSKELLFQAIVAEFLKERENLKPIKYSSELPLCEQLREFAKAELFLIDDPVRRGLSRLLTSTFLINIEFGKATRGQYEPHLALIEWLNSAKADGKMNFESSELAARMFYGMVEGCLTWGALMSDGATLKFAEPILDELISIFLSRYGSS